MLAVTEPEAAIIVERSDKIFFPKRRVLYDVFATTHMLENTVKLKTLIPVAGAMLSMTATTGMKAGSTGLMKVWILRNVLRVVTMLAGLMRANGWLIQLL